MGHQLYKKIMEWRIGRTVAQALGDGFRMASALSLALILFGSNQLTAQQHRDDGCDDDERFSTADSLSVGSKLGRLWRTGPWNDSTLSINQLTEADLLMHPLLTEEEATAILAHKQRFGDILNPSELVQCGFSVERIVAIKPFLVCDIPLKWQKKQWLAQSRECKSSAFAGAKTRWDEFGVSDASAYQMQLRIHNSRTLSMGASVQRDAGELRPVLTNYHLRLSDFRGFESLILGRYTMQLGQGLVQGGMSGFWNAPLIWARRTPDWGLSEKRGWDEFQGHTGVALGYKISKWRMRGMLGVSRGRISTRIDSMGRIGNLITDGNFASETLRGYQGNTWQEHVTGAMLFGSGVGMAWSSYRYDREWLGKKEWLRPALRAGRLFHYPECWFTKHTSHGGLAFLHIALQCQPNQSPKTAAVGGWIRPLNRHSDISLRAYVIHNQFRPPQGLFNQLIPNHWSSSATYSRGTTGKRSLRWAAELRQPLLPNTQLERPLYYKHQCFFEQPLSRNLQFHCLWQWNNQANQTGWESFLGDNAYPNSISLNNTLSPFYTSSNNHNNPQLASAHKITLNLRCKSSPANTLDHQLTFVPQPNSAQGSYLFGVTFTHRKPFSQLKWAAECIAFDTDIPLYFTPQTLPHEITHYTLSQKGLAVNALIQYAFKNRVTATVHPTKSPQNKPHSHPIKKYPNKQIHLAARSEIILKNTTENRIQPRIFVSLWLK